MLYKDKKSGDIMGKNSIVLYKSAYGFTKKYAEWIAEKLQCDCVGIITYDFNKDYKTIIFGGGLYAGKINGIKTLIKNYDKIKDKELIVFTVGVADVNDAENVKNIVSSERKQIPEEMFSKIKLFHFRGGMDYGKMSFIHQCMMWFMKTMLSKKPENERSDSDQAVIESYGGKFDFSDKNTIDDLVKYCL